MPTLDSDGMNEWLVFIFDENASNADELMKFTGTWAASQEWATRQVELLPLLQLRIVFMRVM